MSLLSSGDHLCIVSCANPPIPPGKSSDNWSALRRDAASKLRERLQITTNALIYELHHSKSSNFEIKVSFEIEIWKINQIDHTVELIHSKKPEKVVLFLQTDEQPWLTKFISGEANKVIANRCSAIVRPTILTKDLLMRLDDCDIFGDF